jgi:hypothetical protein
MTFHKRLHTRYADACPPARLQRARCRALLSQAPRVRRKVVSRAALRLASSS